VIFMHFSRAETPSARSGLPHASCRCRPFSKLPWLLLPLLLLAPATAPAQQAAPADNPAKTAKAAESPLKYSGAVYVSGNRRDPFLNPQHYRKPAKPEDEELIRGTPPPGITGTYIAQAMLEGISLREDRKTAIVRGADRYAYFLKEGDRLFDGYLKTIEADSIILVRETKMRSGRILTQEVTKRLRTP